MLLSKHFILHLDLASKLTAAHVLKTDQASRRRACITNIWHKQLCRYAENQDLVNKNSSVMREQADTIAMLEERLNRQQKDGRGGSAKGDKKRIRELESDVESLKVVAT